MRRGSREKRLIERVCTKDQSVPSINNGIPQQMPQNHVRIPIQEQIFGRRQRQGSPKEGTERSLSTYLIA